MRKVDFNQNTVQYDACILLKMKNTLKKIFLVIWFKKIIPIMLSKMAVKHLFQVCEYTKKENT